MAHFETTSSHEAIRGSPAGARESSSRYEAVFLVIIALCTYLHIPLSAGGRLLVPSFPTVALAPLLFLAVRRSVTTADVVFLLKIGFLLLLSIALSPGYVYVTEKFFALIQFSFALTVAVMIVRLMLQIRGKLLERTLLVLWCLILVGAVLEVMGVTRDASDAFREMAYGGTYTLYDADLRDMDLVGWLRPKLFSTEPSHVTKIFIAATNAWLLVRVSWAKIAVVTAATLAMLLIMGSPMLIISAAITLAIVVWDSQTNLRTRVTMLIAALLIGGLFAAFYGESTISNVVSRVENVTEASSDPNRGPSSEERRMIYPYVTLVDTLVHSPLFGTGVGGKEVIVEFTTLKVARAQTALGNNSLAEIGIFLGVGGGAAFIYLVLMHAGQTGVRRVGLMVIVVALFSQLMGGIDSFRYWGFIALLWGALAVADRQAEEGSPDQNS